MRLIAATTSEQEQTDTSNTPTIWNYGYDKNDQLLSATRLNTGTNAVLSQYVYGYDPAGNRASEEIGPGVTQTSVNTLNQITSTGAGGPLQFSGTLSKPSQVTVGGNTATYGNYYSTNFTGLASVTPGTNVVSVVAHDVNGNTATNKYQVVVPPGSSAREPGWKFIPHSFNLVYRERGGKALILPAANHELAIAA